jgi:hypothetical protein
LSKNGINPKEEHARLTTQPSTSVKEGVSELFESNPELANVGTPQQYSEWLNYLTTQGELTGTQATKILYHGTYENFEEFDEEKLDISIQLDYADYIKEYINKQKYEEAANLRDIERKILSELENEKQK